VALPVPRSPDALLTRHQVAAALTAAGFPVKPKTLATKASSGGGPPFHRFGSRPLYRWGDALVWAEGRLSTPNKSNGQLDLRTVLREQAPCHFDLHVGFHARASCSASAIWAIVIFVKAASRFLRGLIA
jgi:hypothetical protein